MSRLPALPVMAALLLGAALAHASLPTSGPGRTPDGSSSEPPELRDLGAVSFAPAPKRLATEIHLANGVSFDTRFGEPALARELLYRGVPAPGETVALLVQVGSPVETGWVDQLEAAGARVEFFVPNSTFLVRCRGLDRAAISALEFVEWTGLYHPGYRISGQEAMEGRSDVGQYQILLFSDGLIESVTARVEALGGTVEDTSDSGINRILRVEMPSASVTGLALHRDVQWIEPREVFTFGNDDVQWVDQTNLPGDRKVWNGGLTGAGQVILVGDSGIRTSHDMYRDASVSINTWGDYPTHRKIIAYLKSNQEGGILFGDSPQAFYHGTHTCGTVAGNDAPHASDLRDGIAKDAKIYFLDCAGDEFIVRTPGDLNTFYQPGYDGNAGGAARISSNSWGADVGGEYTIHCMTTDQFAYSHPDFLICFANGNNGWVFGAPVPNSVGSPASAKNILSVGGTVNGTQSNILYLSTSRGPTDDGRIKPTICTPGQSVSSAHGGTDSGYVTASGTSMACPSAAASAALIRQYFMEGRYPTGSLVAANEFVPSAALLRALMVNSGVDNFAAYSLSDQNIGWGRILLDEVLYFPGDTRRTIVVDETDGVATGEAREYEVYVTNASDDFKVTLVWNDPASTPAAATNLVNDLDLVVMEGGNTYLGNVYSASQSITGGSADGVNVEENVRRATPVVGHYRIRVEGANVPFGPAPYALVISGALGGDAGVLALDRPSYSPGADLGIRVEDTDAGGSVTVTVESTTEAGGESIVLPGGDGVYEGVVPLTLATVATDGMLSVSDGDAITVTYVDSSPSQTTTASATVDASVPVISDVSATSGGPRATVSWTTSSSATSRIEYGTTTALGSFSTEDVSLVTSHAHVVEDLLPEMTYYFDVLSTDHRGNTVRDDFGGMHYRFTTGKPTDILIIVGDDNTVENLDYYDQALESTGWTYEMWRAQQAAEPLVGDSSEGMRAYKAVWWQVGWEQYPPFTRAMRDSLSVYHDGGGRLALASHDVAWAFGQPGSGFYSATKAAWVADVWHGAWTQDPSTWSLNIGYAGDPISGDYTGGVPYQPHRDGAAGDEVNPVAGSGTVAPIWQNNDISPREVAVRWESGSPLGTPGQGVWGGENTRVASMFYEWLNINAASANDVTRNDILDKTLIWLVGGDHPDAAVLSPNGGENVVSSPVSISWTTATDTGNGRNPAETRLEWSDDGGMSWTLITSSPGASPYSWDVSGLPTGNRYRVRAVITDDGSPALGGNDASDADFTVAIPGNETLGPIVVAGTPGITPNPVLKPDAVVLSATVTDALTGGSNVVAAEWSVGGSPATAGGGSAMTGAFGTPTVDVSANIDSAVLPLGATSLWVRGQDAAGNWGNAAELPIQVNGDATDTFVTELPVAFALAQNSPNPFRADTRIVFALPDRRDVALHVYDVSGRRVRTLLEGSQPAGRHQIVWDGRNDGGGRVSSGVYFYRLTAGTDRAERKMIRLR